MLKNFWILSWIERIGVASSYEEKRIEIPTQQFFHESNFFEHVEHRVGSVDVGAF